MASHSVGHSLWRPGCHSHCRPVTVGKSLSQAFTLSASHSVGQSLCRPATLPASHFLGQSLCRTITLLVIQTVGQSLCRPFTLAARLPFTLSASHCRQVTLSAIHSGGQSLSCQSLCRPVTVGKSLCLRQSLCRPVTPNRWPVTLSLCRPSLTLAARLPFTLSASHCRQVTLSAIHSGGQVASHIVGQLLSASHSLRHSLCRPVTLPASHSVGRSLCRPVTLSATHYVGQSLCRSVTLSANQTVG